MAVPGRLGGLHHTKQPLLGAPICGRERSNVPGAPFCSGNALPTSTSLPRLGPELPLHFRTAGEVVVDAALLAAPVRRPALRQVERPSGAAEDGEWARNDSADGSLIRGLSAAAVAAAAPPPLKTDAVAGPGAQGAWTRSQSEAGVGQVPGDASCSFGFDRSAEQQHLPPSPPSASSSAALPAWGAGRGRSSHGGRGRAGPYSELGRSPNGPRQHDALLSRVLAANNWYELRAVLISSGSAGALASSPDAVLAVLRRLAAVASYDMRPPEAAQLGAFLERWLLQHTEALRLMGPTELSLCLHSLAKMARAVPAPPPAWTTAWFAASQPYLLQCGFRPKDLSLSLWALSRLQLRLPPAAVQLLLAAAEPHLPRFNGQDLSLVALALSALQARSGGGGVAVAAATAPPAPSMLPGASWQAAFLERCAVVLPECGSQALSNLLHGIVRSGMAAPDWLLGDLCAALYGKLPECTPQALANVLSALAAVGYLPEEGWVERFLAESAARMGPATGVSDGGGLWGAAREGGGGGRGVCNLDDLTHMAAAAAQLALAPPRGWVSRLYGAMEQQIPRASPRQLAQLLHAVAQLYRAAAVPSAAEAAAPLPPLRSLLAAWHRAAAAALPGFNAIDAAHSLWALAALGERPPPDWLQRLLVTCRGGLAAAPPGDLAVLAWSLAALRFRPTWSWLADVVAASEPALYSMSGQDYAMLTTALVRLGCRPQRSWSEALLGALAARLGRLEDRALSQTAWALYRLRVQPPPEWLAALAAELRRRWGGRAAAEGGEQGEEGGRDGGGSGEELRHTVVLLWVMSMWLGGQQRRERGPGSGRGGTARGKRRAAAGLRPSRPRVRLQRRGGGAAVVAGSPSTNALEHGAPGLGLAGQAGTTGTTDARPGEAATRRSCHVTARMLRRRRAVKVGNLVASLGGDVHVATAFRRRIADQLIGPAMDATVPALAAGRCTPQDVALLAAVAARLPRATVRRATAARPAWRWALLAAATPRLGDLPAEGLLRLLGGLQALRLPLEPERAAAAARAALPHLSAPHLPAEGKVALLRRLCRLRVSSAGLTGSAKRCNRREARAGPSTWAPVLEAGLRTLRRASDAAQPMLRLEVELLKARMRLRKLGLLAGPGGVAAAAAAMRRLNAARAAALAAAAAEYDAPALVAAAAEVRAAVAAAAEACAAAASDEDDDEGAGRRRHGGSGGVDRQRGNGVPPIGEEQRAWIWARARRTVASRVADSSPVLVAQLVELVSEQGFAIAPPLPSPSRQRPTSAEAGASSAPAVEATAAAVGDSTCRRASLFWLAAATRRRWGAMLPAHRTRAALAWRRVLESSTLRKLPLRFDTAAAALGRDTCSTTGNDSGSSGSGSVAGSGDGDTSSSGSTSGSTSGSSGSTSGGEVDLQSELRALLPPAVTARRRGRLRGVSCGAGSRAAGPEEPVSAPSAGGAGADGVAPR